MRSAIMNHPSITVFPSLLAAVVGFTAPAPLRAQDVHSHTRPGVVQTLPEHPAVGESAPDFRLNDPDGRSWALGEFLQRGYLVLEFGSATSIEFRKRAPAIERLAKDWERMEVKVLVVYTREAHPGKLRKKAPQNYGERAALARSTRKELRIGVPLLVDDWEDSACRAYGEMPNAAFLLDRQGILVARQAWTNVPVLEKELRRLLKVESP